MTSTNDIIMNDNKGDDLEVGHYVYNTFSFTSCPTTKNKINIPVMKQKSNKSTTDSGMISNILKLTIATVVVIAVTTTIDIITTHDNSSRNNSSSIKKDISSSLSKSLLGIHSNGDNKCEIASGTFGGFSEAKDLDDDHDKQTNFETCFRKGKTNEYCWSKSHTYDNWLGITSWEPCKPQGMGGDDGWAMVKNSLAACDDDYQIPTCGAPCTLFSN
mmetsp:Transcript_18274/g.20467  ORF Transcript_18274/g.20467 Transcript_18274/m.20467 type:complete len:216 (+) Transcript_18274:149-796(+)